MAQGNPLRLVTSKNRAIPKILGNAFKIKYVYVQFWSSLNKEDCNFIKQDQTQLFSTTTLPAEFIERALCMKDQGSAFIKGKAWFQDRVLFLELICKVVHKIYQYKMQDHLILGIATRCGELRETRSNTAEYRILSISISTVKLPDARRQNNVTKLIEMFDNISVRNNSLKTWVRSRRSTGSARNHKKYSKVWTAQRSSNLARVLQNFNVLIAIRLRKSGSFIAVAREILKYSRSPTTLQKTNRDSTSIPGFAIEKNSSRGPKHSASERQIMFLKAKEMLKKARQSEHDVHPLDTFKMVCTRRIPKVIGGAQCWREGSHAFRSHRSWKARLFIYKSWTATERQTLGSSIWMLMGARNVFDSDKNLPMHQNSAVKMTDARLAETQQSPRPIRPEHQQRQRQDQQFEGAENFDSMSHRKTGWRYCREGETRRQRLHLQLRSGKRVGAHGISHHLRNGGDFGFLEKISENRRGGVERTHTHKTHSFGTVCSQARNAHTTRLAQELHYHLCAPEKSLIIWCVSCLFHGCSLTRLPPWALPLNLPHNENTQYIPHISKFPQSTSCAIKNHSGVKACRVAENRARQLPQVMSPKSSRLSQGSKHILEIHINSMMYRRKLEKKITELLSPKKWRNLEWLGRLAYRILKNQRRPTSNRRRIFDDSAEITADFDLEDGDDDFTTVCPESFRESRCDGHAGEKVSEQNTRAVRKFEVSFIRRTENLWETQYTFRLNRETSSGGSVFRNANPSNLRESFLEGNKDHLLNQARSDLSKQELHVESLKSASVNYNDKRKSQNWHFRTHNTDLLNLDENKFDCQKNCLWKKKVSEILKSSICTKWDKFRERENIE